MTKIAIIRCQERALSPEGRCSGWECFETIREKKWYMAEYDTIELVGFDTCGGCPGKDRYHKIKEIGLNLKDKGAEVIHLSTCLFFACPNKHKFKEVLEKEVGVIVREKTHAGITEKGGTFPPQA